MDVHALRTSGRCHQSCRNHLVHQELVGKLSTAFLLALSGIQGASVYPGVGVSDNPEEWTSNFRCPDVAIYLPGNPALDCDTHWLGGPDFAVEIVSKWDRSHDKFGFYASVGVRGLLFVERRPWSLELYRRDGQTWKLAGVTLEDTTQAGARFYFDLLLGAAHNIPQHTEK